MFFLYGIIVVNVDLFISAQLEYQLAVVDLVIFCVL